MAFSSFVAILSLLLSSGWIHSPQSYRFYRRPYHNRKERCRIYRVGKDQPFRTLISLQATELLTTISFPEEMVPQLQQLSISTSTLLAESADFAEQIIEKVGPEVYRPIFLSGILLGFTGVLAAALAALLVGQFNLSEELNRQFDEGKEAQLVQELVDDLEIQSPQLATTSKGNDKAKDIASIPDRRKDAASDIVEGLDL